MGASIFVMADVFSGSALIPCLSRMCPTNLTVGLKISHLPRLRVAPTSSRHFTASVDPKTSTSSISTTTPSSPSSILFILSWNNSGAQDTPKGSLLNLYRPKGVMKVVSGLELSDKGICQKPLRTKGPMSRRLWVWDEVLSRRFHLVV